MKYSVVIPTYNHCDDLLKPCVQSIIEHTDLSEIELVISANGCTDSTAEYLQELIQFFNSKNLENNLKIVWNAPALGYPKATNEGIKVATCDKIILFNNDNVLLKQNKNQWLDILSKPFLDNSECGISCIIKSHSKIVLKDFAVFFCVMIDRKVFDTIGLLNETYGKGSGEDIEFCIFAQDAGFKVLEVFEKHPIDKKYFTGQFPIYHFGEGTVHDKNLVPDWDQVFLENSLKLARKYNEKWNEDKMKNDYKIAVITPTHNSIEFVFNTISCVKSQTVDNVYHYIYDDGSTDGISRVINQLCAFDEKIRFLSSENNSGQSHARNEIINQALKDGCDIIAFLDSDDYWEVDHLEKCLSHLGDTDVVYSTPKFVDQNNNQVFPMNIVVPDIFVGKQLLHNNYIWISSVVAKSRCFSSNKFDSSLDSIEDWDMWIRLHQQNFTFKKLDIETVRYLVRETGQAAKGQSKRILLEQKHKLLPKLKLHLACGHDYNDDYINVDLYAPEDAVCDVRFDVQKLPYPNNSVDEIKAFHIIEHFNFFEIKEVFDEWYRVLKPGGKLYLETPDFLETCRSFVEGSPEMPIEEWRVLLYGHFFAHPWVPGQTHKFLFTENQLRTNLGWASFKTVNRVAPASKYVMNHTVHLFLTVEAFK
jgi:teichuronic acid biosynthesis glycosyltransferase TuaG